MNDNMKYSAESAEKKSEGKRAVKTVISAALAGCLITSLGLNIYQASRDAEQNKKVNKFIDDQLERQAKEAEKENTYQEDGYMIGDQYEIRSTAHISDAYKSGNDAGLEDEDKETLQMASDVLKEIIKKDMNSYEKELAVYDWMYKNIGQGRGSVVTLPGSRGSAFTPHDVLSGQSSVCVGYATTFRLFMNMLDMDCHIVHNEYHSWDMVQLDDNEWYQVDIYTDVSGKCEYQNFNMTDKIARSSHDWDDSALPEAKGLKYSYAVQNSKELKNIYAVPAKIKKCLDKKKSSAYFKFEKPLKREELPIADLLLNQMNTAMMSLPGFENHSMSGMWYQDEQDQYILAVFIQNYAESDVSGFDETSPEGKKLIKAVAEAFGTDTPETSSENSDTDDSETDDSKTDDSDTKEDLPAKDIVERETVNMKTSYRF